jgi:hypothetical protein
MINLYLWPLREAFNVRHSWLDLESGISVWIFPFVRMTDLDHADIYATFRVTRRQIAKVSTGASFFSVLKVLFLRSSA